MANETIMIHNVETDEIIIKELSDAEQAERDAEVADWLATEAQSKAEADAAKAQAEAKLAALGLTPNDLKAIGL